MRRALALRISFFPKVQVFSLQARNLFPITDFLFQRLDQFLIFVEGVFILAFICNDI